MKNMQILLIPFFLFGCEATSNIINGQCQIEETTDTFTQQINVEFTSCVIATSRNTWDVPPHRMGFSWYQDKPEKVRLNISYSSDVNGSAYTTFKSMRVRIDGVEVLNERFSDTVLDSSSYNSNTNNIYTSSRASLWLEMDVLEKMAAGKSVTMRVNTSDGYSDYIFDIAKNGSSLYAYHYMPNYITTINKYR